MSITLDQLIYGVRMVETSGRKDGYSTVNGIGAVGAYQVMKANIPSWTKEALGHAMTWQAFRDSPKAQDAVARYKLGGYYRKYGAEGAAAMWFSGQPNPNSTSSDGGNTVRQYVNKVVKWATGSNPKPSGGSSSPAPSGMPTLGHGIYTAQQAGYQADTRTNSFGAPVNPYKLPGWIASQNAGAGGSSGGVVQASDSSGGNPFGGDSVPWDGVSTMVLSTLFVLGGLGLVVVGMLNAVSPAVQSVASMTPAGAAAGAVKGAI